MVTALYVRQDSIYKELGIDCYDIHRDARTFPGGTPVVCHPPCRSWGQLAHMSKPRAGERDLAILAIQQIRQYGGVLEHPRASKLWKELSLPTGNQRDEYGGFTMCINQHWFGHRAEKKTLIYICGIEPSEIPSYTVSFDVPTKVITQSIRKGRMGFKSRVTTREREATPIELAKWLIAIAEKCKKI